MSEIEPPLEDQLTTLILDIEEIAKKLNKPIPEIMPFLMHRELMIINKQLTLIHEHLDLIEDREQAEKQKD